MRKLLILLVAALPIQLLYAKPAADSAAGESQGASLRPVAVMVPHMGIGVSIDIGRVAVGSNGGGLLGALLVAGLDRDRVEVIKGNENARAEAAVAPLARVLEGFDAAGLAMETTRTAIMATDQFDSSAVEFVPGQAFASVEELVEAHPSEQIVLITYSYQMSPNFEQIQVVADITVAQAHGLKPLNSRRVMTVVGVNKWSYEPSENVAKWAMDDGQNAKTALAAAFDRMQTVMPAVLALTPEQYERATDKKANEVAFAAGFQGPVLMRDTLGPVIWSKDYGFVAVLPAVD